MTIPDKFKDPSGQVNAAALAQSLTALGGNPSQFIVGTTVDVNGMAGAYVALEAAKNASAQNSEADAAAAAAAAGKAPEPQPGQLNLTEPSGPAKLDWSKATQEILATGDVTPATREVFVKAGVPDSAINQQVAGIKAQQEVSVRRLADSIGGMAEYNQFIDWANQTMTVEQRQGLFSQMSQPGGEFALQGAFTQYKAATANAPAAGDREPVQFNTTGGGGGAGDPAGAEPFTDQTQRHAAFADPRYRSDPEFRANVQARAQATSQHVAANMAANPAKNWHRPVLKHQRSQ